MHRRDALKNLGLATLALAAPAALGAQTPRKHFVWMRPDIKKSADDWKREFARLKAAGIDGINPEVFVDPSGSRRP